MVWSGSTLNIESWVKNPTRPPCVQGQTVIWYNFRWNIIKFMICMSSRGFSCTPAVKPFLEIISDTVYIPKKQMPVIMNTKWLLEGPWERNTLSWDTSMIVVSAIEFLVASNIVELSWNISEAMTDGYRETAVGINGSWCPRWWL